MIHILMFVKFVKMFADSTQAACILVRSGFITLSYLQTFNLSGVKTVIIGWNLGGIQFVERCSVERR